MVEYTPLAPKRQVDSDMIEFASPGAVPMREMPVNLKLPKSAFSSIMWYNNGSMIYQTCYTFRKTGYPASARR